jgi:hypothetical protein
VDWTAQSETPRSSRRAARQLVIQVYGSPTPVLWGDIGACFRKRPLMAGWILCRILPLPILEVGRFHENTCAVRSCLFTVNGCVVHPHHHGMRDLTGSRRPALSAYISHDDCAVTECELRPMVFANPYALDESERFGQPVDGLSHVRVDEDGNHTSMWDGAVGLQVRRNVAPPPEFLAFL